MGIVTAFYLTVWAALFAMGWRRGLLPRYPLFYCYVLVTAALNLPLIIYSQSGPSVLESTAYLHAALAVSLTIHAFEIALALRAYLLFAHKPAFKGFVLALILCATLEYLIAPVDHYASHALHVVFLFQAYCAYRAAVAAFLGPVDPGSNWRALIVGLLLSSVVLAINHAGSLTSPTEWPYHAFATVMQGAQMGMWLIFLFGFRRYCPIQRLSEAGRVSGGAVAGR